MAILGLFSKMNSHYHSYVFLEIHHDWIGSRFLIENLCRLLLHSSIYWKSRQIPFSEYISASVYQARYLLIDVKEQLKANHPDLLILRDKLETFITKEQEHAAERPPTTNQKLTYGDLRKQIPQLNIDCHGLIFD